MPANFIKRNFVGNNSRSPRRSLPKILWHYSINSKFKDYRGIKNRNVESSKSSGQSSAFRRFPDFLVELFLRRKAELWLELLELSNYFFFKPRQFFEFRCDWKVLFDFFVELFQWRGGGRQNCDQNSWNSNNL